MTPLSSPSQHPSFPRFLGGRAGVVCSLVSHGPQGGRAGDAPWFGHGAPHPSAPAFTPLPIHLSALHLLLPAATAPTNQGKESKTQTYFNLSENKCNNNCLNDPDVCTLYIVFSYLLILHKHFLYSCCKINICVYGGGVV